ncbi:Alpha/Beta hydrolase protein [Catenaria anguillulae PL171]|uniref:Alpha/Beta hydrolase protein n=1 Tax=Catenaria anguillulae PL171 TaxID=765915 RepID=A0A1Y2HY54_9FUNG|nr:Alpha/Beta hydrolase protein [Catenaria anguillulae PL171]
MPIKPKFLRDTLSIVFTLFYLVFANRATTSRALQPKVNWLNKRIHLPRAPTAFGYDPNDPRTTVTELALFFSGSEADLPQVRTVILHIPGGGFVCMGPDCHEDYLVDWAHRSPYTLVVATNGECLGLAGWYSELTVTTSVSGQPPTTTTDRRRREPIRITISGDSAGGNLATGVVSRCIENKVMLPDALILIYPHLNFDMACWLSPQQQTLLRVESAKHVNAHVDIHRTHSGAHLSSLAPLSSTSAAPPSVGATPTAASLEIVCAPDPKPHTVFDDYGQPHSATIDHHHADHMGVPAVNVSASTPPRSPIFRSVPLSEVPSVPATTLDGGCPLALTSHMAHFNDRVLTPEIMRALALLYVGPSPVPVDLEHDYYLSPIRTPDHLLAQFPKTYLLCGEKDPLVDDTVIFAGRLRDAKHRAWSRTGARNGVPCPMDTEVCEVVIMEGVSHAVLQMHAFLPEAKDTFHLLHSWLHESLFPHNTSSAATQCFSQMRHPPTPSSTSTPARVPVLKPAPTKPSPTKSRFTIGGSDMGGLAAAVASSSSSDEADSSGAPIIVHRASPTRSAKSAAGSPSSTSRTSSGRPSPSVGAKQPAPHAAEEDVPLSPSGGEASNDDHWYEFRDNARVAQNLLLARRTMQVSQGLFDGQSKEQKESFKSRVVTPPGKGASASAGSKAKAKQSAAESNKQVAAAEGATEAD